MSRKRAHSESDTPSKRVEPAPKKSVEWLLLPRDCLCWMMMYIGDMQDLDSLRQCSRAWSLAVKDYAQVWRKRMRRHINAPDDWAMRSSSLNQLPNGRLDGRFAWTRCRPDKTVTMLGAFFNGLFHGRIVKKIFEPLDDDDAEPRERICTFSAGRPIDGRWKRNVFEHGILTESLVDFVGRFPLGIPWRPKPGTAFAASVSYDSLPFTIERLRDGVRLPSNMVLSAAWGQAEDTYSVLFNDKTTNVIGLSEIRLWLEREVIKLTP